MEVGRGRTVTRVGPTCKVQRIQGTSLVLDRAIDDPEAKASLKIGGFSDSRQVLFEY